jgi:hypothetical protein
MSRLPDIQCNSLSIKGKTIINSDRAITCRNITGDTIHARQNLRVGGWLPIKLLPITLASGVNISDFRPTPDTLHLFNLPTASENHTLAMLNESMAQYNLNVNEGFQFSIGNSAQSANGTSVILELGNEGLVLNSGLASTYTSKWGINTYALVRTSLTEYTVYSLSYINTD